MPFTPTTQLESEVTELLTHYPEGESRSAALMVLHTIQAQEGFISTDAMKWAAERLNIKPIHLHELVTFYPMLREVAAGKYVLKVCRTLSCALAGGIDLHKKLCGKLDLDAGKHGLQTTADGKFSVEFAECLASCGTGPVMMCNDDFYEAVDDGKADKILGECQ